MQERYVPSPEDIIRVEAIELPTKREPGEGLYEWRHLDTLFLVDMLDLKKEFENVMPGKSEDLLDRIQNFRKLYINLVTGEVTT